MLNDMEFRPLTPDRWDDLVDLFGPERGANSGCWCMWPLLRAKDWQAMAREERRDAFHNRVSIGSEPGLLGYHDKPAICWVAVGPRENYVRFQMSRTTRPLEEDTRDQIRKTYALTCFFVRKGFRNSSLMWQLIKAASIHAKSKGAHYLDACPIETDKPLQWGEGFVGIASVFRRCGFEEVARRSPRRPLMRLRLT